LQLFVPFVQALFPIKVVYVVFYQKLRKFLKKGENWWWDVIPIGL